MTGAAIAAWREPTPVAPNLSLMRVLRSVHNSACGIEKVSTPYLYVHLRVSIGFVLVRTVYSARSPQRSSYSVKTVESPDWYYEKWKNDSMYSIPSKNAVSLKLHLTNNNMEEV